MERIVHKIVNKGELSYRILASFVALCFLTFIVTSITYAYRGYEPYFFFSWFVFPRVPSDHQIQHDILLLSVAGMPLPEPTPLLDTRGTYALANMNPPEYHRRFEFFSWMTGQPGAERDAAKSLIDSLITAPEATYELVEYSFNPIERWKDDSAKSVTIIGTFEKNQ